jgi:hypothetical protein
MKKALIVYEDRRVSLITEDAVFHLGLRSTVDSLIHEELKTFIKEQTRSSFLHAPDYIHAVVGMHHLTLPSAVYLESNLPEYSARMYGPQAPLHEISATTSANGQVTLIHSQPTWLNELVAQHFNGQAIYSMHQLLLNALQRDGIFRIDLHCFENQAYLGIYHQRKLWYSDFFEFTLVDDLIYMMINTLNQFNVSTEGATIRLSSTHSSIQPAKIEAYLKQIEPLNLTSIESGEFRALFSTLL